MVVSFDMLYPAEWLEAKAEGDPEGKTNRDVQKVVSLDSNQPLVQIF
jgi:hypothetical protein